MKKALFFVIIASLILSLAVEILIKDKISLLFNPVQTFFVQAGYKVGDYLNQILKRDSQSLSLKACREDNLKLLKKLEEMKLLKEENQELKKLLKFTKSSLNYFPQPYSQALVKSAGMEPFTIIINKGSKDNVAKGDLAISGEGVLIGKIIEVNHKNSVIETIFSPSTSIPAETLETKIQGILKSENQNLVLSSLPKDSKPQEGELVITSKLSKDYPSNLLLGKISTTLEEDILPFKKAYLKPFFELEKIPSIIFLIKLK